MINHSNLPSPWRVAQLREVSVEAPRRDPRKDGDGEFLYVDVQAVDNDRLEIAEPKRVKNVDAPSRARHEIRAGDVLFSLVRPYLRNIARVPHELDGQIASSAFCVVRPSEEITTDFLFYAVQSNDFIHSVRTYGESPPAARDDEFLRLTIPVPPLDAQGKIVAVVEQQLSRVDAAIRSLRDAIGKVRTYRTAVFSESVPPEAAFPKHWSVATVGELAERVQYGTSARATNDASGIPVLRMGNIVEGNLSAEKLKYLPTAHDEFPGLLLQLGDLLFNRTNSRELVGKSAVYRGIPSPCSFASYLIRVQLKPNLLPDFLAHALNGPYGRRWISTVVSQQVGQANVSGSKLKAFPVPVPPMAEQRRFVERAEARLSFIDVTLSEINKNLARAQSLRQAILRQALSGRIR